MNLHDYFTKTQGFGVLTTSNVEGDVNAAIYTKPTVADDGALAFNMLSRLSYAYIQSNPKAAYMFIESGEGYRGKRLYLTKVSEKKNDLHAQASEERHPRISKLKELDRHMVFFRVDRVRPLVDDSTS
jgi:hypothetical protein